MASLQGPFTRLTRPPRQTGNWEVDSRELFKWFDRVWFILAGIPGISWTIVSKTGSKLSDIETRPHAQLQDVLQTDVDLTDTDPAKHVTNALSFDWDRNRCYIEANAASFNAVVGTFHSVTCSTADITATLPDASLNAGMPIWIHKTDATVYKITTSVKDILFQNTTMHLISNGTDWVIS
jgi:hypothetical protein